MPLAVDNHVVQAFPANGPNQPFGKTVVPRWPRRNWLVPNAHCPHPPGHDWTKDAIVVADHIFGCRIPRERFRNLAHNPIRRRAVRHADPDELSTVEPNDDEAINQAEGERRIQRTGRSPRSLAYDCSEKSASLVAKRYSEIWHGRCPRSGEWSRSLLDWVVTRPTLPANHKWCAGGIAGE